MSPYKLPKEIDAALYPDIAKAGSLSAAISKRLLDIGSDLIAEGTEVDNLMPYARVELGVRSSQIYIADGKRLFLFDFWSEGIMFGKASHENISDVVRAINTWISNKSSIEEMSNLFNFFSPTEDSKVYEAGIGVYVEYQWHSLLESWRKEEKAFGSPDLTPTLLIEAAMKRPELRQLYPFTSLISLCFSRTTGFPFTKDCPRIEPQGDGMYVVYEANSFKILGKGKIEEVLDILIKHLPPNCGPAINGTADNLI